jgi:hypothetical protein
VLPSPSTIAPWTKPDVFAEFQLRNSAVSVPAAAVQLVVARAAVERVVLPTAGQDVGIEPTCQVVIPVLAEKGVHPAEPEQVIVASPAAQRIVVGAAEHRVVEAGREHVFDAEQPVARGLAARAVAAVAEVEQADRDRGGREAVHRGIAAGAAVDGVGAAAAADEIVAALAGDQVRGGGTEEIVFLGRELELLDVGEDRGFPARVDLRV